MHGMEGCTDESPKTMMEKIEIGIPALESMHTALMETTEEGKIIPAKEA